MRIDRIALVLALALAPSLTARAGHHQWNLTEVFSNADGTIQFVELIGTANNEQFVNGFTITASSGPNVFTFVGNLPSSATNGKWALVGTSAFALAAGAPAPDYVLPDNFFDPTSDTLNYAGVDSWAVSNVPVDGVNSLDRATGVGTNTPTNFAGQSGSIDVSGGPAVPSFGGIALVVLTGLLLLAGAGISRRRPATAGV
jgi:hypothetical protein